MGTGRNDTNVFAAREPAFVSISSANLDFQLIRAPHADPANSRKLRIKKLIITNISGRPCDVVLSDLDMSDSAAASRGSANSPLMRFVGGIVAQSGTSYSTVYDEFQMPGEWFEAGVTVQSTQIGTFLNAEFEQY